LQIAIAKIAGDLTRLNAIHLSQNKPRKPRGATSVFRRLTAALRIDIVNLTK